MPENSITQRLTLTCPRAGHTLAVAQGDMVRVWITGEWDGHTRPDAPPERAWLVRDATSLAWFCWPCYRDDLKRGPADSGPSRPGAGLIYGRLGLRPVWRLLATMATYGPAHLPAPAIRRELDAAIARHTPDGDPRADRTAVKLARSTPTRPDQPTRTASERATQALELTPEALAQLLGI